MQRFRLYWRASANMFYVRIIRVLHCHPEFACPNINMYNTDNS